MKRFETGASDDGWYRRWFNRDYLKLYSHRDDEEAGIFLNFLIDRGYIKYAQKILDFPCGVGRHLQYLLSKNYNAYGMDLSTELLNEARKRTESESKESRLVRGDIRYPPFKTGFDIILNLFTSFGYFEDDDNRLVLNEIFRMLSPGGKFVLDFINIDFHLRNLIPEDDFIIEGAKVKINRKYNSESDRLMKKIEISREDDIRQYIESIKCLRRSDLMEMFKLAGFKVIDIIGSYDGSTFNEDSSRMILIGEKLCIA
ncbi:class I SAM-dependent methyltransferase [bacterium]|nr:class I SAM-dependent methyltransferase [FCB group bacterium]MBL7191175.1 class I SAM-dependent methyltransferase [bacterium]